MPLRTTLRIASCAALALATVVAVSVHAGQTPSFEVASVRLSDPGTTVSHRVTDTRVDLIKIDLRQLLWMAFEIDPFCCRDRIPGAESLNGVLLDVRATIPAGAGRQQVPGMLQSLLIERFGLRTHVEPRPTDGYELVVGQGGIKMTEVQPANDLDTVFPPDPSVRITSDSVGERVDGRRRIISSARGIRTITERSMYEQKYTPRRTYVLDAIRMTMPEFASLLSANTGRPVIDRTNLTRFYAFSVELPRDAWMSPVLVNVGASGDGTPLNDPTGVSAPRAVEPLGLRLQPRRIPVDTIVIDRIERVPTEN
jgi:uncharacterized protein (TIGR03435 family)